MSNSLPSKIQNWSEGASLQNSNQQVHPSTMLPHKTTLELLPTVAFLLNWIAIAARSKPDTRSYKGQQCPQKYHTVAGECHYEALKNKQYKQGLWRKGLIMKFILPLCLVLWSQCCTLMLDSNDEGVIKCTVRSHICLMLLLLLKLKWEYLHKNRKDRWHIIYDKMDDDGRRDISTTQWRKEV